MPAQETYYPDNLAMIAQIRGAVSRYDDGNTLIARLNRGQISLEEAALTCGADTHMPAANLLQRIWDLESPENREAFIENPSNWVPNLLQTIYDLESAENREAFIENPSNWLPDMLQTIWDLETPENRAEFLAANNLTAA